MLKESQPGSSGRPTQDGGAPCPGTWPSVASPVCRHQRSWGQGQAWRSSPDDWEWQEMKLFTQIKVQRVCHYLYGQYKKEGLVWPQAEGPHR